MNKLEYCILLAVLSSLCLGLYLGDVLSTPKTVTEYIILPRRVVTIEVPYPVEVVREVVKEVGIPVPISLRPFLSKAELTAWLDNYKPSITIWGGSMFSDVDCEDYAYTMMVKAIEDGFILDTELVQGNRHVICKAPVFAENTIYFVDWETKKIIGSRQMD